jgi:hypothetical protein
VSITARCRSDFSLLDVGNGSLQPHASFLLSPALSFGHWAIYGHRQSVSSLFFQASGCLASSATTVAGQHSLTMKRKSGLRRTSGSGPAFGARNMAVSHYRFHAHAPSALRLSSDWACHHRTAANHDKGDISVGESRGAAELNA